MERDRNILFGVLAMRLKKVKASRLRQTAEQWAHDPESDLGQRLVAAGALTESDREKIESMVDSAAKVYEGNATAALTAFGGDEEVQRTFGDSLAPGAPETTPTIPGGAVSEGADEIPAVREHPGRYTQIREYASGGMGRILLVRDKHIGRDVALKELLPEQLVGHGSVSGAPTSEWLTIPAFARFVQEAKVTGQLEHPSIVPVYELGYRENGSLYYTMKLVKGRTLQEAIQEAGGWAGRLTLLTHFLNLCQAISYAHSRGVIHRDIKPKNVMVGEFGETVVIDWGIAKARGKKDIHAKDLVQTVKALGVAEESTVKTLYGQALGSPYFMPPEQALGKVDEVDERSDVYSLGAVLYTLLTGQVPFVGLTAREFLAKVVAEPPRPIRAIETKAPAELIAICERAMAREPSERYQNATELAEEIHQFLSGGLVRAYDYRLRELMGRFVRKHRAALSTAAAAFVVLLAVGVYSYVRVVQQKRVAVEQRQLAEEARDVAEVARQQEAEARERAEEARQAEQAARQEAQRELYGSNTALAERCLDERRLAQARKLLAGCPEPYRAWEWGRLQYLSNADRMTIAAGGRFVAWSGDGERLALGSVDGTLGVYAAGDGSPLHPLADKSGFGCAMALSGDGRRMAMAGDGAITVWDTAIGTALFSFDTIEKTDEWGHAIALNRDGTRLAARTDAKTVRVWDVDAKRELSSVPIERNMGFTLAISSDGGRLLTAASVLGAGSWENRLELRDAASGEVTASHSLPAPPFVHAALFSPDGVRAAIGTDADLTIWKLPDWTKEGTIPTGIYYPSAVAFSPDGGRLAAASRDKCTLTGWNVAKAAEEFHVRAHLDTIHAVEFDPSGRFVATASSDRLAKVWDASTGTELRVLRGHNAAVFSLAFSPDGARLATAGYDGVTKVWDVASDLDRLDLAVNAVAYSAARDFLAGASGPAVCVWDARSGVLAHKLEGHSAKVIRLVCDAEGATLASAAIEKTDGAEVVHVRCWDPASGKRTAEFTTELSSIHELAFSADGASLAVRGGTVLEIYEVKTGKRRQRLEAVHGFQFAHRGGALAVGRAVADHEKMLRVSVMDGPSGEVLREVDVEVWQDLCIGFSPDGAQVLAGNESARHEEGNTASAFTNTLRLWNIESGEELPPLACDGAVTCFTFSADGTRLVTGGRANKAALWDLGTRAPLATFEGHAGAIRAVLLTSDAKRLVTASSDGTFRLWDCETGRELLTLQDSALRANTANAVPSRVAFSRDERRLVVMTDPEPLPPFVLHSFPVDLAEYPGDAGTDLGKRVEAFKRTYR
ncbi:MAG TPA: protein kinase [Candidatus Hydrogenedentes bacterium]|nr:protein kinase [Candidatus Hydrogenedentota bacterium]HPG68537.1 protein kinase [Candidatus Hydrogenedentota bacterium]